MLEKRKKMTPQQAHHSGKLGMADLHMHSGLCPRKLSKQHWQAHEDKLLNWKSTIHTINLWLLNVHSKTNTRTFSDFQQLVGQ